MKMQKTTVLKPGEFERNWYIVDASGKTLGRLATRVASIFLYSIPNSFKDIRLPPDNKVPSCVFYSIQPLKQTSAGRVLCAICGSNKK